MAASATTQQKVERLKQNTNIQKALEQTLAPSTREKSTELPAKGKQRIFLGSYLLLLVVLGGTYYLD